MIAEEEASNFDTFKDCLSTTVIQKLAPSGKSTRKRSIKGRKNEIKPVARIEDNDENDAADLAEFIEYLAEEIFPALPTELRTLSYSAIQETPELANTFSTPIDAATLEHLTKNLPPSVADSLISYNLTTDPERFLEPALSAYISATTAPPPEYTPSLTALRPEGCEICGREHLPLTYHHLIPRAVHAKAVKRGWHAEWELNKVAWLCRACHSFVHKVASNEVLARELFSVELLLEREDVRRWAGWVGRVRWKAR